VYPYKTWWGKTVCVHKSIEHLFEYVTPSTCFTKNKKSNNIHFMFCSHFSLSKRIAGRFGERSLCLARPVRPCHIIIATLPNFAHTSLHKTSLLDRVLHIDVHFKAPELPWVEEYTTSSLQKQCMITAGQNVVSTD
jgi:hypothetical protein